MATIEAVVGADGVTFRGAGYKAYQALTLVIDPDPETETSWYAQALADGTYDSSTYMPPFVLASGTHTVEAHARSAGSGKEGKLVASATFDV